MDTGDSVQNIPVMGKAMEMMKRMGYKEGCGLGKLEQGMLNPIDCPRQISKRGLGMPRHIVEKWTSFDEGIELDEEIQWLINNESSDFNLKERGNWLQKDLPKTTIINETKFSEPELLINLLNAKKDVFQTFNNLELCKARSRANPFETLKAAFFMNRAALKMANIDAATDFMFSGVDKNPHHMSNGPHYFADVCAGPGGFSEYILWRKNWCFKGFGFTLKGEHDFKLFNSTCCSVSTFRSYYGKANDGNVCNPENIKDFALNVMHDTENKGVHFMMADGGFSVEGNEELQEVLSKQIYACQCLVALEIVRPHGHFVTKLFDTFTEFSVGLIFLMYQCFEKIAIFKPSTSRPANSERYLICSNLKESSIVRDVRNYLRLIVHEMWTLSESKVSNVDLVSLVPFEVIAKYEHFKTYIIDRNNKLGKKQVANLIKLAEFCKNQNLFDERQDDLRTVCLKKWNLPDKIRSPKELITKEDLLIITLIKTEFLHVKSEDISNDEQLAKLCANKSDWTYCPLYSARSSRKCGIFVATADRKIVKLHNHVWLKIKNLKLIKGTILFGEVVMEKCLDKGTAREEVKSLHVIDAIRLGDTIIVDLPFKERLQMITAFCKAMNFETCPTNVRLRPKVFDCLGNISNNPLIHFNEEDQKYQSVLPTVGIGNLEEKYNVHSMLFLKTDDRQQFHTTYVLRARLFIDSLELEDDEISVKYETLIHGL